MRAISGRKFAALLFRFCFGGSTHRLDLIALANGVHNIQPFGHFAEYAILIIQAVIVHQVEIELAVAAVRGLASGQSKRARIAASVWAPSGLPCAFDVPSMPGAP